MSILPISRRHQPVKKEKVWTSVCHISMWTYVYLHKTDVKSACIKFLASS